MCSQFALLRDREKQEPRRHSAMTTLVLGAHGRRRGEAMLDSGTLLNRDLLYLSKQSHPALSAYNCCCVWVSPLVFFLFVDRGTQTRSYVRYFYSHPSSLTNNQSTSKVLQRLVKRTLKIIPGTHPRDGSSVSFLLRPSTAPEQSLARSRYSE